MTQKELIKAFQSQNHVPAKALLELGKADEVVLSAMSAVLEDYSTENPYSATKEGTGSNAYVTLESWLSWSSIRSIESPTGSVPKSYLGREYWSVTSEGYLYMAIQTGATYKATYKAMHSLGNGADDETDITTILEPATFYLITAARIYSMLYEKYIESIRSDINADSMDGQQIADKYKELAKDKYAEYRDKAGLPVKRKTYACAAVRYDKPKAQVFPDWMV